MHKRNLLWGLLALSLSGGLAADTPQPQILDGLWRGTFDINNQGRYDFTALYVNGQVAAYSVDTNVVYRGTVIGDDKKYQSNMSMFIRDGSMFGTVQLEGTVGNQATSIVARYMTTGQDTGMLGLIYNPLFERTISVPSLEGLWEYSGDKISLSINISATGDVKGTDSAGCNYYGSLAPIRPDINALDIQVELASCSTADGSYGGMAYLSDENAENDTLHLNITGEYFGMYYPLKRTSSAS